MSENSFHFHVAMRFLEKAREAIPGLGTFGACIWESPIGTTLLIQIETESAQLALLAKSSVVHGIAEELGIPNVTYQLVENVVDPAELE